MSIKKYLCPSCGEFRRLQLKTGFCTKCTNALCSRCRVRQPALHSSICNNCKLEQYLENNADALELLTAGGLSITQAVFRVRDSKAQRCLSCGGLLKRAPRSAMFCRSNEQCRRAVRRYVYLYRERGFTKDGALQQVLAELNER